MKILILKDKHGKTLATFEKKKEGPKFELHLQAGHSIEEMEVPERYISDLNAVYKTDTR